MIHLDGHCQVSIPNQVNQAADADNTKSTVYFNTENKQNEVLLLINLVIKLKKFLHKKQLKKTMTLYVMARAAKVMR